MTIEIDEALVPIVKLGLDVLAAKASDNMEVAKAAMKYITDSEARDKNQKIYDDNYARLRKCDAAIHAVYESEAAAKAQKKPQRKGRRL